MMNFSLSQKYTAVAAENLEFQRGMLNLAAMTPNNLQDITIAFKKWCASTPFPWQVALDYCLDRARRGLSLPFVI